MYKSEFVPAHSIIRLESFEVSTTMKRFICVLLLALVAAEPPRYRKFKIEREEELGSAKEFNERAGEQNAPYSAAGFRPNKEFRLPSERQELTPPSTSYGLPDNSYKAPLNTFALPQAQYGVPIGRSFQESGSEGREGEISDSDSESVESSESNERSEGNSEEKKELEERFEKKGEKKETSEKKRKEKKEKENLEESDSAENTVSSQGVYYVLLPDSQLQRIQFQTVNDVNNMAYSARLQYRNEDRAPVYVYSAPPQYQAQYQPTAAYSAYGVYQW